MTYAPSGWEPIQLGDVVGVVRSREKPQDHPHLSFIGMQNVEAHTMRLLSTVPAASMKSSAVHFQRGDVLYGRLRPYLNKVLVAHDEGLASAEFIPLTASAGVDPRFICYRLNAADFVSFASRLNEGDRPRVDFQQIAKFAFALPPTAEQARIIKELDSCLSRLSVAKTGLDQVRVGLARYRASVLHAAFSGHLVPTEARIAREAGREYEPADALLSQVLRERRRRWEQRELERLKAADRTPTSDAWKQRYKEPIVPKQSAALPEGWCWATWSQVGLSQNGRAFPSKAYSASGIKLLRPGNLHASGRVDWTAKNTRRLPERWAEDYATYIVGPNELVMNLTAQSLADDFLGRVCLTGEGERCLLNQRIARLVPIIVEPRFLLWLFMSPLFRRFVGSLNTGSLIQHMFTRQLDVFQLPLPPIAEQQRISLEIERHMSLAEAVERSIQDNHVRLDHLRQAVLQWAFSGRLTDQNPKDEPAIDLLGRIAAEREVSTRSGHRRPKRRR